MSEMIASFLLLILGSAFIIIWLLDINNNPDIDFSDGLFHAREKDSNNIFWFHILAELITGLLLILGGSIILLNREELMLIVYFASGSLFYTSLNSLGWAFAYRTRLPYAYPMIAGLIISILVPVLLNI